MQKILIVCAHPDDDILGCGGIMAKYASAGIQFRVVIIAEGSSCRYNHDEIHSEKVNAVVEGRNQCGIKALAHLGITDYRFYNLPCGRLDTVPLLNINKIIEQEIKEFKPDTIFTHSEIDTNNDHRIINRSVMIATRPVNKQNVVKTLYSFEILSSTEWNFSCAFEPNYFEELSFEHVKQKWEALEMYESEIKEFPFPRSFEGISTLAKLRGVQSGTNYAEAFKLIRKFQLI
jgi:LmbE family N-acetylglucosaminyl deacetylase